MNNFLESKETVTFIEDIIKYLNLSLEGELELSRHQTRMVNANYTLIKKDFKEYDIDYLVGVRTSVSPDVKRLMFDFAKLCALYYSDYDLATQLEEVIDHLDDNYDELQAKADKIKLNVPPCLFYYNIN